MRVRLDTSIAGAVEFLRALALVNLRDALADRDLREELRWRVSAPAGRGFVYENDDESRAARGEPPDDEWSSFTALIDEAKEAGLSTRAPLPADCEDLAAAYGAAILLFQPAAHVEVAICQPRPPDGMAHAYLYVNGRVFDPAAFNGMSQPPPDFYGSGESFRLPLTLPEAK